MKAAFRRLIAGLLEHQVRRLIRRHQPIVVAVGGSVGKTTTKMAVAAVLQQKYRVLVRDGNYNTQIGLPLSIFELTVPRPLLNPFAWISLLAQTQAKIRHYPYQVLVLELGTDHPGEVPHYLTYLASDLGIITAITPEHMANFPGGLDQVAAEELALAPASRRILVNGDNLSADYRHRYLDQHPSAFYYGLGQSNDLDYSLAVTQSTPLTGTVVDLYTHGRRQLAGAHIGLYGAHSARIAAAAYAAADLLGLTATQIKAGFSQIAPVPGRMNPLPGLNGSIILDDSYNAAPDAVLAALKALTEAPATRRLALLGSMNELGPDSPHYHQQVGTAAAHLDYLVTVGALAGDHLLPAAVAAGLDPSRAHATRSPHAAAEVLRSLLKPGDVLLVKGSETGLFLEEAVKLLLAHPADAGQLVRQSPAWLRTKAKPPSASR